MRVLLCSVSSFSDRAHITWYAKLCCYHFPNLKFCEFFCFIVIYVQLFSRFIEISQRCLRMIQYQYNIEIFISKETWKINTLEWDKIDSLICFSIRTFSMSDNVHALVTILDWLIYYSNNFNINWSLMVFMTVLCAVFILWNVSYYGMNGLFPTR